MRTIYLILTITICISIILFVTTFFYIDTHRHTTLFYNIYQDKKVISTVKLDKYNTEEKIVYKSVTDTPFHSISNKYKRNLSIDKKGFKVHSYNKKRLSEGVNMDVYIRRMDSSINFLAVGHSNFSYAKRLLVGKDFVIFEEDAIISYFNLIDKYDFKKGGPQFLYALTHAYAFLPPYKSEIEIRLVKEETIEIDGKKTKALHFKVKLPDKKEILIWANRWTHIPLIVKVPKTGFEAVWQQEILKQVVAKKYTIENDLYQNREITFKNKDITLAGTFSIPNGKGPHPAIILVWGPGPQDRDALGMFIDLADGFAQKGIAVFRFDKRGRGKSEGDFSRFTGEDLINDISCALDFLIQQEEIDKEKIAILGHSEGGYYAASLAAGNPNISACIILAGIEAINLPDTELERTWSFNKSATNWDKEYLKDIAKSAKDTSEILNSGKDWALLLHKRVYLKKCRLDIEKKPFEVIRKVKVPVLILRGKRDTVISPEHIRLLEEALKEGGNENHDIIYFNRLNHFFGKKVEDGIHRTHLSINKEVISTIIEWLDKNLISPPKPVEVEEVILQEEGPIVPEDKAVEPKALEDSRNEIEIIKEGVL